MYRIPNLDEWPLNLSGKQKSGILQPFLCLCVLPSCIRSRRSWKLCTELSEILGVTCYPEKLARRKSLLVFCVFLCNHEQTVLLKNLKKKSLSLAGKKNQTSAFFAITTLVSVPFSFFRTASVRILPSPPTFPSVRSQMRGWNGSPSNLTFSRILMIW